MAEIMQQGSVVAVLIKDNKGDDTTLCVRDTQNPAAILFGTLGGITCNRITKLADDAPDGAKSKVEMTGLGIAGVEQYTGRSREPADQIAAKVVEAGFARPEIATQGRLAAFRDRVKFRLGQNLA